MKHSDNSRLHWGQMSLCSLSADKCCQGHHHVKHKGLGLMQLQASLAATLQDSGCWSSLVQEMSALHKPPLVHANMACLMRNLVAKVSSISCYTFAT